MITMLDLGPDVLAYRAEGKVEREDIDRVFAALEARTASPGDFAVYAEVPSLSGVTLEALLRDVRLGIRNWSALSRIRKAALVTDVQWLRSAVLIDDRAVMGVHIRSFGMAEQEAARAWIRA